MSDFLCWLGFHKWDYYEAPPEILPWWRRCRRCWTAQHWHPFNVMASGSPWGAPSDSAWAEHQGGGAMTRPHHEWAHDVAAVRKQSDAISASAERVAYLRAVEECARVANETARELSTDAEKTVAILVRNRIRALATDPRTDPTGEG